MARRQIAIVFAVLLGVAAIGFVVVRQMRIPHWTTVTSSRLRQVHQSALTIQSVVPGTRTQSPYMLIWDEYVGPDLIWAHRSSRSPVDVLVGDSNLERLLALPLDQARSIVLGLPQSESEWVLLGDFLLSWSSLSTAGPDLVVGISTECPYRPGLRVVIYGDNSRAVVSGTAWLETQNVRRTALGLKPIPSLP